MPESSQKQRQILAQYNNKKFTVLGIFAHYNQARFEFCYDTILLKKVMDENKFPLCDHLWLKAPKFIPDGIIPGDVVRVHGRINEYRRLDGSTDYSLFVFNMKRGYFD